MMSSNLPVSGPAPGEQAAGCDAPVLLQACESTGLTACTHTPTASPGPTCESDVPVRHHHRVDLKMNKKRQETRFSAIKKMRGLKSNWEDRMSLKSRRQQVKEAEEERKTAKSLALQEKRKRREENQRRREENSKKSEVTQLVKNPAKLKRKKKKELKKKKKAVNK